MKRLYYIEWTLTKWVLSQKRELQIEYVILWSAIMFRCRVHLYLQFLLQLVHLYSMNHILQDEVLFLWQKIFIPGERLLSTLWYFSMRKTKTLVLIGLRVMKKCMRTQLRSTLLPPTNGSMPRHVKGIKNVIP